MSQGSQGSFAADGLRFPLSKFSYATVHSESVTLIPWTHLGRTNNLFAIFTSQRIDDGRGLLRDLKKFRVLQDPQVLEDIDLDILAREATRAKAEAQTSIFGGDIPSVTVIVKIPCVAVRYPLEGGQIRRIQIRLANKDDYFETLKILSRANVPFEEAGSFPTRPQNRPFSSSSSLLRPSDSASQIGARPASVSSSLDRPALRTVNSALWSSASPSRPNASSGALNGGSFGAVGTYFSQQHQSSELDEHPLNAPPSNLVSGYFSGPRDSFGGAPPPRSSLEFVSNYTPINLYQPRPATSMVAERQSISQMLPPRRELPFPTSPVKKTNKRQATNEPNSTARVSNESGPSSSSLPDFKDFRTSVTDALSNMESTSQVSNNSAGTVTATTKKRVAAMRATKPRAAKKQQSKTLAKENLKISKTEDSVPSVMKLLQETQEPSDQQQESSATIDTQALLSRAEATRPCQSIELPVVYERPASPSVSAPCSQTRKCLICKLRKGKCNGGNPCDWCVDNPEQCTYDPPNETPLQIQFSCSQRDENGQVETPQSHNGATISLPVYPESHKNITSIEATPAETPAESELTLKEAHSQPKKQDVEMNSKGQAEASDPQKTPEIRPVDPDATLINASPITPPAASAALQLSSEPNPLTLLLRETAFADTPQLDSWALLPESVQRSTLDTYMCQQLENPAFIALVKLLDESWQTSLFGASVGVEL